MDMQIFINRIERRANRSLEHSQPIRLLGHLATTKNISPTGAYLEVTTNCGELFTIGVVINVEISVTINQQLLPSKTVKLTGTGKVVRINELYSIGNSSGRIMKKLGMALHFADKLKFMNDSWLQNNKKTKFI